MFLSFVSLRSVSCTSVMYKGDIFSSFPPHLITSILLSPQSLILYPHLIYTSTNKYWSGAYKVTFTHSHSQSKLFISVHLERFVPSRDTHPIMLLLTSSRFYLYKILYIYQRIAFQFLETRNWPTIQNA